MHPLIHSRRADLADLCVKHGVRRLALFGSSTGAQFDPVTSAVDVLVEFQPMPPAQHADHYLGLMEDWHTLLGIPIDLVESRPIRNPYFRQAIADTQVVVYEGA